MATVLQVFGIAMAVILSLFLAAVIVWVILLKLVKGISGNVLEIIKTIFVHKKAKKVTQVQTTYKDLDGLDKTEVTYFTKKGEQSYVETTYVDNGVHKTERRYFQ